jgi:hypothetical protein
MSDKILLSRLKYALGEREEMCWEEGKVTLEDINQCLYSLEPIDKYYIIPLHREGNEQKYTKEWHIQRILYFVHNPNRITPLEIECQCFNGHISTILAIEDGNHRYLAAVFLGLETIPISFGGRMDMLDYLKGERKDFPLD